MKIHSVLLCVKDENVIKAFVMETVRENILRKATLKWCVIYLNVDVIR